MEKDVFINLYQTGTILNDILNEIQCNDSAHICVHGSILGHLQQSHKSINVTFSL